MMMRHDNGFYCELDSQAMHQHFRVDVINNPDVVKSLKTT